MRNNDRSPVIDLAAMFNRGGATWCNDAMQEIISLSIRDEVQCEEHVSRSAGVDTVWGKV